MPAFMTLHVYHKQHEQMSPEHYHAACNRLRCIVPDIACLPAGSSTSTRMGASQLLVSQGACSQFTCETIYSPAEQKD